MLRFQIVVRQCSQRRSMATPQTNEAVPRKLIRSSCRSDCEEVLVVRFAHSVIARACSQSSADTLQDCPVLSVRFAQAWYRVWWQFNDLNCTARGAEFHLVQVPQNAIKVQEELKTICFRRI